MCRDRGYAACAGFRGIGLRGLGIKGHEVQGFRIRSYTATQTFSNKCRYSTCH